VMWSSKTTDELYIKYFWVQPSLRVVGKNSCKDRCSQFRGYTPHCAAKDCCAQQVLHHTSGAFVTETKLN
jgi:hypothetical protein